MKICYEQLVLTQALIDEDDLDCPYRKVRVAMPKLRRRSKTISESAKGVFIRARKFTRDCTVSLLLNDLLLATMQHIIFAEVVMA